MKGDAVALRRARALIDDLMASEPAEVRDVAVLLTDELVSNAIIHGGGTFSLAAGVQEDVVRVAVTDASAAEPQVLRPAAGDEHGRGMAIVDALSSAWGTDRHGRKKVVWFELELSHRARDGSGQCGDG